MAKSKSKKQPSKEKKAPPIRVKRYESIAGHCLEERVFLREVHETFCIHPRCKFRGKHAAQGVCFDKVLPRSLKLMVENIAQAQREIADLRRAHRKKSTSWRIRNLEAYLSWLLTSHRQVLDELVRLWAENAALRLARRKYK